MISRRLHGLLSPDHTLAEAIAFLVAKYPLFQFGSDLSLECRGDRAFFRQCLPLTPNRHAGIFSLILMIDVIRLAAGPHWQPCTPYISRAAKSGRAHVYEAALSTFRAVVGVDCWTVVFDKRMLEEPLHYCRTPVWAFDHEIVAELQICAPADEFQASLVR